MYFDPAIDIFETPTLLVINVDLAGIPSSKLAVGSSDGSLLITGERQLPKKYRVTQILKNDIPKGKFAVEIPLLTELGEVAKNLDLEQMTNKKVKSVVLEDGILVIKIPKVKKEGK